MPDLTAPDLLLAALLGTAGDAPEELLRAACARLVDSPNAPLAEALASRVDVPRDALVAAYDAAALTGDGLVALAVAVARTVPAAAAPGFVELALAHAREHGDHEEMASRMVSDESVPDAVRRAWCSTKSVSVLAAIMEIAPTSAASRRAVRTYLELPAERRTADSDDLVAGGLWSLVATGQARWLPEVEDAALLGSVILHACRSAHSDRAETLLRDPVMAPLWAQRAMLAAISNDIAEGEGPWFTQMLMEDRAVTTAVLDQASAPVRAQLLERLNDLLGAALSSKQRADVERIVERLSTVPDPQRGRLLGDVGDPDAAAVLLSLLGPVPTESWPAALAVLASLGPTTPLPAAVTSMRAVLT